MVLSEGNQEKISRLAGYLIKKGTAAASTADKRNTLEYQVCQVREGVRQALKDIDPPCIM